MAICYLNGREYNISKKVILDYIDSYGTKFTKVEKDKIANEVMFRMESLEVDGVDCQEYNFIEDRYTEACMCYIFDHGNRIEALLNEEDDCNIWDYLDEEEDEDEDEEEEDYKDFEFWNKEKLWKLRKEICLGSLYYHHYENSFGVPEKVCCDFFDSFVEWCWIVESEEENGLTEWKDVLDKYDNADELWDYFYGLEYPFGE